MMSQNYENNSRNSPGKSPPCNGVSNAPSKTIVPHPQGLRQFDSRVWAPLLLFLWTQKEKKIKPSMLPNFLHTLTLSNPTGDPHRHASLSTIETMFKKIVKKNLKSSPSQKDSMSRYRVHNTPSCFVHSVFIFHVLYSLLYFLQSMMNSYKL